MTTKEERSEPIPDSGLSKQSSGYGVAVAQINAADEPVVIET